jgi:hypothetical protein
MFDIEMLSVADLPLEELTTHAELIYELFLDLSSYNQNFISPARSTEESKLKTRITVWKYELNQLLAQPETYRQKLELKRKLLADHPYCSISNTLIEDPDEADVDRDGKLCHRFYLAEKLNLTRKKKERDTTVLLKLDGIKYECDDLKDAYIQMMHLVVSRLKNQQEDLIDRFTALDFIGTTRELKERSGRIDLRLRPLRSLKTKQEEDLYFDLNINDQSMMDRMQKVSKLFDFTRDFAVIGVGSS